MTNNTIKHLGIVENIKATMAEAYAAVVVKTQKQLLTTLNVKVLQLK